VFKSIQVNTYHYINYQDYGCTLNKMNEAVSSVEPEVKTRYWNCDILFVKILKLYSFFLNQFYCFETLKMSSFKNWCLSNLSILISLLVFPCYYIWVRTNCDMRFINLTRKIARCTCSSVRGSNEPSKPIRIKKIQLISRRLLVNKNERSSFVSRTRS
jgi:hypothetical protein